MRPSQPVLFPHRDPSLPPGRRVIEGAMRLSLISMAIAGVFGVTAFLWNILTGSISRADSLRLAGEPTPLLFILLCLAWWFSLSTYLARKGLARDGTADDPPPPLSLPLTQPKTTFMIAPVWAFVLMQFTATLTWPNIQLNLFGTEIAEFARAEKLGVKAHYPKHGKHCDTYAWLSLSEEVRLDHCLSVQLYNALRPGDGVQMSFLVYGELMRLKSLRPVPAAEMPQVLTPDPELIAILRRRATKDQSGTSAQ